MSRDGVTEILDLESALETGSEETPEGRNEGGECAEDQDVEVNGIEGECFGEEGWVKDGRVE
jgi:hypothetical protein